MPWRAESSKPLSIVRCEYMGAAFGEASAAFALLAGAPTTSAYSLARENEGRIVLCEHGQISSSAGEPGCYAQAYYLGGIRPTVAPE
jgi:hypothetical protein